MKKVTIKDLELDRDVEFVFYSDIETLPIKRYQLIQKYTLIDAGIGSTIPDVLNHFAKLDKFMEVGEKESMVIERENMHMNLLNILEGEITTLYIYASLIKTIDGVVTDVNEDTIEELVDLLERSDLNIGVVNELVNIKKKVLTNNLA